MCGILTQTSTLSVSQELGPRFTLKLESIQKGTFDSTGGEFEWLKTRKMEAKRKFFL